MTTATCGGPSLKDRVESVVSAWVPRLGLRDWKIRVLVLDVPDESFHMKTSRDGEACRATIRVSPDCEEDCEGLLSAFDPEQVVVHELLHVAFTHLSCPIGEQLEEHLGSSTAITKALVAQLYNAEEHICDRMSIALVEAWRSHAPA